jgi:hypothetical protein
MRSPHSPPASGSLGDYDDPARMGWGSLRGHREG